MKNGTFKMIGFAALLIIGTLPNAFAKITLQPDFEGSVMITTPEGKVTVLSPGDPIPDIPSQSKIEVFDGNMKVQTEDGDTAVCACGGNEGAMSGGASAQINCQESEASIEVLEGKLILRDEAGQTSTLEKGTQKELTLQPETKKAAETGAGNEIGAPVDSGIPPVDSRSIDSSPNQ